jgi:hypothetical protein
MLGGNSNWKVYFERSGDFNKCLITTKPDQILHPLDCMRYSFPSELLHSWLGNNKEVC